MSDSSGNADPSLDADLETLIQLIGRMFRGIKDVDGHRHGPGHGPGHGHGDRDPEELIGLIKAAGLGPRHVPALVALVLNGPVPVGVLARHMALNPATVSQLLGELERGGFVERRPDDRDRRRMIVSLDEAHREAIEAFAWRRLRPLRLTLERLEPVEREHFLKGWRVLVDSIEQARAHGSGGGCPGG